MSAGRRRRGPPGERGHEGGRGGGRGGPPRGRACRDRRPEPAAAAEPAGQPGQRQPGYQRPAGPPEQPVHPPQPGHPRQPGQRRQPGQTGRPSQPRRGSAAGRPASDGGRRIPRTKDDSEAGAGAAAGSATGPRRAAGQARSPDTEVIIVQGIARYHRSGCILIRFLGSEDLESMTLRAAEEAGCVPCKACRPEQELADD